MFEKRTTEFNRKTFITSIIFIAFIEIMSIFQLVIMWLTSATYSLFIVPSKGIDFHVLQAISATIIVLFMLFGLCMFWKIILWKKRKFFLRNHMWTLVISLVGCLLPFIVPNVIPVNFIVPIAFLFAGTSAYITFK